MLLNLIKFECKYHSKQLSFVVFVLLFFFYGLLSMTLGFDFLSWSTHINATYNISLLTTIVSLVSVFGLMFFAINGSLRDISSNAEGMVYSTGITKSSFFIARFSGIFIVANLLHFVFVGGVILGTFLTDTGIHKVLGFNLKSFVYPWLYFTLPNLFVCSSILFSVTMLARKTIFAYLVGIIIFSLFWVCSFLINSPLSGGAVLAHHDILDLVSIFDFFGLTAFFEQSQFLTAIQKDTFLIAFKGHFLWNRIIWVLFSVLLLLMSFKLFKFRKVNSKVKKEKEKVENQQTSFEYKPVKNTGKSFMSRIFVLKSLISHELKGLFLNLPFLILMILWVGLILVAFYYSIEGQPEYGGRYPTTNLLIGLFTEPLPILGLLLVVFYSGEIIWKEKELKIHELIGATSVSNSTLFISKFFLLSLIPFVLLLISIVISVFFQSVMGYHYFHPIQYLSVFYFSGAQLWLYVCLAVFIQLLISNKYLAMLITGMLIMLTGPLSQTLGIEHPLLLFMKLPSMVRAHSDLTGYGQYVYSFNLRFLLWFLMSVLFIFLCFKLRRRGVEHKTLKNTFGKMLPVTKHEKAVLGAVLTAILFTGSYIFYNTNIVNEYISSDHAEDFNENYERKFKKYAQLPVPSFKNIKHKIDIFPSDQSYKVAAHCMIKNTSEKPMDELFISTPVAYEFLKIENAELIFHDDKLQSYLFKFNSPFQPGDQIKLNYKLSVAINGFDIKRAIQKNGTYIKLSEFSPILGYYDEWEIEDDFERSRRNLPKREEVKITDSHLLKNQRFNFERVKFESIVSTSENQTAITSGDLINQWKENGRSYFHYKTNQEIAKVIAYFSADYKTKTVKHKGINIEMYYHGDHDQNINEMMEIAKTALNYCSNNFRSYPFKYLRIAEIPSIWGPNGQAMPGVISLKETSVYTKDVSSEKAFNVIARILIHEISHQWWGHQLMPKRVEGAIVIAESLAKYTEAVVLEKLYGYSMVRKLSNYTIRRYFAGRSFTDQPESPLYIAKTQQYLGYSKGYSVLLALKDVLGEEVLNKVLRKLLKNYSGEAKVTTIHFLEELYAASDPLHHEFINDLLKEIITYDLKIEDVKYKKLLDGKYEIKVSVLSKRYKTIEGKETEISINEPIKIGLFKEHPETIKNEKEILYFENHQINKDVSETKIIVDQLPNYVGIDPFLTRLDKNRRDNVKLIYK